MAPVCISIPVSQSHSSSSPSPSTVFELSANDAKKHGVRTRYVDIVRLEQSTRRERKFFVIICLEEKEEEEEGEKEAETETPKWGETCVCCALVECNREILVAFAIHILEFTSHRHTMFDFYTMSRQHGLYQLYDVYIFCVHVCALCRNRS